MKLKFRPDEIYQLIDQLLAGVKYLHGYNIVHRDLKPDNIFLTQDLYLKIGDFGLASLLQIGEYTKINIGTRRYMAPEVFRNQETKLEPDIWAVGCIIYEILTLTKAFNGSDPYEISKNIVEGRYNKSLLNEGNNCSKGLSKLVQSMLIVDRKSRPDIFTIYCNYLDISRIYLPIIANLLKLQSTWKLPLPIINKTLCKSEEEKVMMKGEISKTKTAIARNNVL